MGEPHLGRCGDEFVSSKASILAAAGRPSRMVAMVLGTALSTLGTTPAPANAQTVTDLSRYCTACWRNARLPADCWTDCTQEVFARLLERVPTADWGQTLNAEGDERREFLRAIDAVKKRVQRGRRWSPYPEESVADRRPLADRERAEVREELSKAAGEVLSERQMQILQMTAEGWGVNEIADRLSIGPERVSDEKYKAIRKLRVHLHERMAAA
jgi:RNA polymerase sigma factor (sigma-70 family)